MSTTPGTEIDLDPDLPEDFDIDALGDPREDTPGTTSEKEPV